MQQLPVESFDEFLSAARKQPERLRLLLVFARKEQQDLTPVASVDKDPGYLESYAALANEAQQMMGEWDAIYVGALPGQDNEPPTVKAIDEGGDKMVRAIRNGSTSAFLLFDREGKILERS